MAEPLRARQLAERLHRYTGAVADWGDKAAAWFTVVAVVSGTFALVVTTKQPLRGWTDDLFVGCSPAAALFIALFARRSACFMVAVASPEADQPGRAARDIPRREELALLRLRWKWS